MTTRRAPEVSKSELSLLRFIGGQLGRPRFSRAEELALITSLKKKRLLRADSPGFVLRLTRAAERMVKPLAPRLRWGSLTIRGASLSVGGRLLVITVQLVSGCYVAAAVETDMAGKKHRAALDRQATMGDGMAMLTSAIFDQHGHDVIGQYRTFELAQEASERYAVRWERQQKKLAACACGPIAKAKKKR